MTRNNPQSVVSQGSSLEPQQPLFLLGFSHIDMIDHLHLSFQLLQGFVLMEWPKAPTINHIVNVNYLVCP